MTTNLDLTSDDTRAAAAHFAARLRWAIDASDLHAALETGDPGFVLVDSRGDAAWAQGRIPGAIHLPLAAMRERAADVLDPDVPVVTYCWGPGCDGATRAALELSLQGYRVREMIGGFEYWAREGLPVVVGDGAPARRAPDPLTAPVTSPACDC
ncbi:rhodanese-like domain-containing protein [Cellulomonas fimi]|uniref:rhodanese-like domain-containing protein n=1 Tax=Cellulomonas fimi TaxID=1708 RepID=UPI00234DD283|nr:rhodanese-like domain-containing protein [Cellulomonas fimi]MDC7123278.1 rhodanese-like domain-containing protein [Cellulomonas fimi]